MRSIGKYETKLKRYVIPEQSSKMSVKNPDENLAWSELEKSAAREVIEERLQSLVTKLGSERPIFCSKKDFSHALVHLIQQTYPTTPVRVDYPLKNSGSERIFCRISAKGDVPEKIRRLVNDTNIYIDLIYAPRRKKYRVAREVMDVSIYKSWVDTVEQRALFFQQVNGMENAVIEEKELGFVIFLSDEVIYRELDADENFDFSTHEYREVNAGSLVWSDEHGNIECEVDVRGRYHLNWHPYGMPSFGFQFLLSMISPRC